MFTGAGSALHTDMAVRRNDFFLSRIAIRTRLYTLTIDKSSTEQLRLDKCSFFVNECHCVLCFFMMLLELAWQKSAVVDDKCRSVILYSIVFFSSWLFLQSNYSKYNVLEFCNIPLHPNDRVSHRILNVSASLCCTSISFYGRN